MQKSEVENGPKSCFGCINLSCVTSGK
jgi:hypothetical protein